MHLTLLGEAGVAPLTQPVRALMLQWGRWLDSEAAQAHLLLGAECLVARVQVWALLLPLTGEWPALRFTQSTAGCSLEPTTLFGDGGICSKPGTDNALTPSFVPVTAPSFSPPGASAFGFLVRVSAI